MEDRKYLDEYELLSFLHYCNVIQNRYYDECYLKVFEQKFGERIDYLAIEETLTCILADIDYAAIGISTHRERFKENSDVTAVLDSDELFLSCLRKCCCSLSPMVEKLNERASGKLSSYSFFGYLRDLGRMNILMKRLEGIEKICRVNTNVHVALYKCSLELRMQKEAPMICIKCGKEVPDAPFCCQCGALQERKAAHKKRGNRQGTVYKKGNLWYGRATEYSYVVVGEDGKKEYRLKRVAKSFPTKKEALAWAVSFRGDENVLPPTLLELWEGYSNNDMTKLSDSKQTAYKIARKRLESIISRRIDTLTVDDLQAAVNEEASTYYPAKDMRDLLSNLYKRAMASNNNNGKVSINLAQFIVLPGKDEKEVEPFTAEEVEKIWKSYNEGDSFAGYILLLLYSGMMPIELMTCTKDMIDLDKCEIFGCGHKTTQRKKEYAIVFPDFLRPVVEKLMNTSSTNNRAKKEKLLQMNKDNFYKEYYLSLERAGVRRLAPYSCRHTYGTEAVKLAIPPAVIKQMLRHASTKTQERYTHLSMDEAHTAANAMKQG